MPLQRRSTLPYFCELERLLQAEWNYGANFGGPTKASWTSGADSLTSGAVRSSFLLFYLSAPHAFFAVWALFAKLACLKLPR